MITTKSTSVVAAFEALREAIETEINLISKTGAQAFEGRDYDRVHEALARTNQLIAFQEEVMALRTKWENISPAAPATTAGDGAYSAERPKQRRHRRGVPTSEHEYYRSILQALVEEGEVATLPTILKRVEQLRSDKLKPVDRDWLDSDPNILHWQMRVKWACNTMVTRGLLKFDPQGGTWELTETGCEAHKGNRDDLLRSSLDAKYRAISISD